ncbi:MAG: hypothetical protein ICV76_03850 [Nitrospiraceae bacterium]|nr:hypothetical protein [Nitrospiraceae bacterium]
MKVKITPSIGNVFRDLGFRREEAEHLLVRADLMIQAQKLIASRRLKLRPIAKYPARFSIATAISSSSGSPFKNY